MPKRRRRHATTDTIDNGTCNEELVAKVLGSFNNAVDKDQYRPWTDEEERETVERLKNVDREQLKRELVSHNVFLAAKFLKKYKNRFYSISTEDLVSNIYWGLVQAAERFDVEKGCRFATFAYWYIRKWVLQPFQTNQWKVANATTKSFSSASDHPDSDDSDPMACREADIMSEADASLVMPRPEPVDAVMTAEESEGRESEDDLLERMRKYALSGAFTKTEHEFYTKRYIDGVSPRDIRKEWHMSIGEYRKIDRRITESIREHMLQTT